MEDHFSSQRAKRARSSSRIAPLTQAALEAVALRYLNRFDATRSRVKQVLERKVERVRKALGAADTGANAAHQDLEQSAQWIEQTLTRLCDAGYVDDQRYARNLTRSLLDRGCSPRQLQNKLRQRGVPAPLANDVVAELASTVDDELRAASRLVKRRRMGYLRTEAAREPRANKDLAALARAGFSFQIARRALSGPVDD